MSDDEVISGLQAGGRSAEAALKALAKGEISKHMLRFFQQQGAATEDTLDILQETLIRISRYASNFRAEGSAKSWFWQIARSALADHWRKQSRAGTPDPEAEEREAARLNAIRSGTVQVVENGVKVTRIPYGGRPTNLLPTDRAPWIGTVDEEQWSLLQETVAATDCTFTGETASDCVARGFETFSVHDPERAYALGMQMDGLQISDIADRIGRTASATKEYLSQCRKKVKPYIEHCRDLQKA